MKCFLILVYISIHTVANSQKPKATYNTKIDKAEKVNINVKNYIDTQIVYNQQNNLIAASKMYLIKLMPLFYSYTDSITNIKVDKSVYEYTFGNPDNVPVTDVNIVLEYDKAFDTAYFEKKFPFSNGVFDLNTIRDSYGIVSPDKKKITFKASYIGANTTIKITVESPRSNVRFSGIGKSW